MSTNISSIAKSSRAHLKLSILNLKIVPIALLDYLWVILFYYSLAFWLAVIIDGYMLPPFVQKNEEAKTSLRLFIEVFVHIALQGFVAFMLHAILKFVPSPLDGVYGYVVNSTVGDLLRNPAIITTMLLFLSNTLHQRMLILFSRFNKNYKGG
uniref:Uncharacterized protein n=1 Tax=viral metagenome TaxID=1070528 RepID=A0A6C0HMP6_9ZZZZ